MVIGIQYSGKSSEPVGFTNANRKIGPNKDHLITAYHFCVRYPKAVLLNAIFENSVLIPVMD
jgi:hypothetical protein